VYDYDRDLANLEDWLRRLKTEYHIFFNKNRKKPPDDLKMRLERLIKKLSECSEMSFAQRFRLNTLVTRFCVYRDLWRRTMLDQEMGKDSEGRKEAANTALRSAAETQREHIRISISDPIREKEKVRELYDALRRLHRTDSKELPASYRQFTKYIAEQTSRIREENGCARVAFTIAVEEDAIRFIAAAEKL
jgi:hypothetical protein